MLRVLRMYQSSLECRVKFCGSLSACATVLQNAIFVIMMFTNTIQAEDKYDPALELSLQLHTLKEAHHLSLCQKPL